MAPCSVFAVRTLFMLMGLNFTKAKLQSTESSNLTISGTDYINGIVVSTGMKDTAMMMFSGTPYYYVHEKYVFLNVPGQLISIDVDYRSGELYYFDLNTSSISVLNNYNWQTNFKSMNFHAIHEGVSATRSVRIALDWVTGNIYWTDPIFAWIGIQRGQSDDQFKILITDGLTRPQAIAVDPSHKFIFWSDIGTSNTKIERASLVGNHRVVIVTRNLVEPVSIAFDQHLRNIVWIDAGLETIEIADFDGESRKVLRRLEHSNLHDLMVFMDIVLVTDLAENKLYSISKLTGEIKEAKVANGEMLAVAMYSITTQPIKGEIYCNDKKCEDICVNDNNTATCLCQDGYTLNEDGLTCSEEDGRFYRTFIQSNTTHICLMDIRRLTVSHTHVTECIYTSGSSISTFDIDISERRLLVADGSTLYYVNDLVSQSQPTLLLTASDHITGLAVDLLDRNIYWTMGGINSGIYIQSLSSGVESTFTTEDITHPRDILLRPFDSDIIWVSGSQLHHRIEIAKLSGRGRTTITTSYSIFGPKSLALDKNTKTLYFIDGSLKSCNMDGTEMYTVLSNSFSPRLVIIYKNYLIVDDNGYPYGTMKTFDKRLVSHIGSVTDSVMNVTHMAVLDVTLQQQQQQRRPVTVPTSPRLTDDMPTEIVSYEMTSQSDEVYTSHTTSSPLITETTTPTLSVILVAVGIIVLCVLMILLTVLLIVVVKRKRSRGRYKAAGVNQEVPRGDMDTPSLPRIEHPPTAHHEEAPTYETINEDQMMYDERCTNYSRDNQSSVYNGYLEMNGMCVNRASTQNVDCETTFYEHPYDGMYITPVSDRQSTDVVTSDCNMYPTHVCDRSRQSSDIMRSDVVTSDCNTYVTPVCERQNADVVTPDCNTYITPVCER